MTTIPARNAARPSAQVVKCRAAAATTRVARSAPPAAAVAMTAIAKNASGFATTVAPTSVPDVSTNTKGAPSAMKKDSTKIATTTRPKPATLRFSPTAWAKLLLMRDLGDTEIGGFGITPSNDLL